MSIHSLFDHVEDFTDVDDSNLTTEGEESGNISLDAEFGIQIIYLVIGILGMPGNLLVITIILSSAKLRHSITNVLIVHQSCIDFLAAFFIVITSFVRDTNKVTNVKGRDLFCRMWATNLPIWGLFLCSTYGLVVLTCERYIAIVHTLQHMKHCCLRLMFGILPLVWLLGIGYNAAYMIPTSGLKDDKCTVFSEWPSQSTQRGVGVFTVVLQYFIPLCLIAGAYTHIAIVLKRKGMPLHDGLDKDPRRQEKMIRASRNVVKTLLIVSICFILCWSPNQIYYLRFNLGYHVNFNGAFYHFTVIAVFLNCCINPFVYALQYEQFQRRLIRLYRRVTHSTSQNTYQVTSSTSV